MGLAVAGIDHSTCPIAVRERLALNGSAEVQAIEALLNAPSVDELVVLSTCARTEFYLSSTNRVHEAVAEVRRFLVGLDIDASEYIVARFDSDAVRHLFRVNAGLESQVVGETEIAGQVRSAVQVARHHDAVGTQLDQLFQAAAASSRRTRRETNLGTARITVAAATVAMAERLLDVSRAHVLILGSGRVARMLATEFSRAEKLTIGARSPAALSDLQPGTGTEFVSIPEARTRLGEFDVICAATRSRSPLISLTDFPDDANGIVFDLSIPRNAEPDVANIPGITVFDIDAVSPDARGTDVEAAANIIEAEVHDYIGRQTVKRVAPIIAALKDHVERVREQETLRTHAVLSRLDERDRSEIEALLGRMIDRMFHHLVVRLKLAALSDPELIRAAEFFFAHGDETIFPESVEFTAAAPTAAAVEDRDLAEATTSL